MTQEQITAKVESHLRSLDIRCPYCQTLDIIGRPRFVVIPFIFAQKVAATMIIPMVKVECTNCHTLTQFSAMQLGLIEKPEPKSSNIKGHIQQLADMKRGKN